MVKIIYLVLILLVLISCNPKPLNHKHLEFTSSPSNPSNSIGSSSSFSGSASSSSSSGGSSSLSRNDNLLDFGGMFGIGYDFNNNEQIFYNNPATGGQDCPDSYTEYQILGLDYLDFPLWICLRNKTPSGGIFDFGGIFGWSSTANGFMYDNPITGASRCPKGFTRKQTFGSNGADEVLYFCYKYNDSKSTVNSGFGGIYSYYYPNPATGDTNCPSDSSKHYDEFQVYGTPGKDYALIMCYNSEFSNSSTSTSSSSGSSSSSSSSGSSSGTNKNYDLLDFGGMFGSGFKNNKFIYYNNPATGGQSCPDSSYTASHLLGMISVDFDLYICLRPKTPSGGFYDFGGVFGGTGDLVNYQYNNPVTGTPSCPKDFIKKQTLGTDGVDWQFDFCYRKHVLGSKGKTGFGGIFGWGDYTNFATGELNCPEGYDEFPVYGTLGLDYSIYLCYKGGIAGDVSANVNPKASEVSLPALIEAENYVANDGDVGVRDSALASGGKYIYDLDRGNAVYYDIYVPEAGRYSMNLRVSSNLDGAQLTLFSNSTKLADIPINNTKGETNFKTIWTVFDLQAGSYRWKFLTSGVVDQVPFFDYFEVKKGDINQIHRATLADLVGKWGWWDISPKENPLTMSDVFNLVHNYGLGFLMLSCGVNPIKEHCQMDLAQLKEAGLALFAYNGGADLGNEWTHQWAENPYIDGIIYNIEVPEDGWPGTPEYHKYITEQMNKFKAEGKLVIIAPGHEMQQYVKEFDLYADAYLPWTYAGNQYFLNRVNLWRSISKKMIIPLGSHGNTGVQAMQPPEAAGAPYLFKHNGYSSFMLFAGIEMLTAIKGQCPPNGCQVCDIWAYNKNAPDYINLLKNLDYYY